MWNTILTSYRNNFKVGIVSFYKVDEKCITSDRKNMYNVKKMIFFNFLFIRESWKKYLKNIKQQSFFQHW